MGYECAALKWREEKKKVINSMREEFQKHVEVVGDKDNRAGEGVRREGCGKHLPL